MFVLRMILCLSSIACLCFIASLVASERWRLHLPANPRSRRDCRR